MLRENIGTKKNFVRLKYTFNSQSKLMNHMSVVYFQMFLVVEAILLLEAPWTRPMRGLRLNC